MLKRILAVILGFVSGFVTVGLIQTISAQMYPPPGDLIIQDNEALEAYFYSLPHKARYIIMLAHVVGCFIGAYIAAKLSDKYKFYMGLLVGVVMFVASFSYNLASFCPRGIFIIDLGLCILAVYLGARLGGITQQKV